MTQVQAIASPVHATSGRRLDRELSDVCRRLDDHLAACAERYGAGALEVVDLPPLLTPGGEISAEQIRATGALLWGREVEEAGLPGFVEALADQVMRGAFALPIAGAADQLMLFRRSEHDRFSPEERKALYERLFAGSFPATWDRFVAALDALARVSVTEGRAPLLARAALAARDLAFRFSEQSGGIAAFAARDISNQVREALRILRDPQIARALGGGSLWRMLRQHGLVLLGRELDPERHLDRASAALTLTGWLADQAGRLGAGGTPQPPAAVLDAAELWATSEDR